MQDEGERDRIERDRQQAPKGAVAGHIACPFLQHPGATRSVLREHEHQIPTAFERIAQANDPILARVDRKRIDKDS